MYRRITGVLLFFIILTLGITAGRLLYMNYWPQVDEFVPVLGVPVKTVEYKNTALGLRVKLPASWKGYTIGMSNWEATVGKQKVTGPKISIVHPLSSASTPRQDIPILVLTIDQWNKSISEEWSFGAAPIGPSELTRNGTYVFALPARYNYAFPVGFEEVDKIIQSKAITAF